MTGLLHKIQIAGIQHENITSDVLAEILNGIPACKKAFLGLFDENIPLSSEIEREVWITSDDEKGKVDFVYRSDDCVIVIENKPWEPESHVYGQISSYAKAMKSWPERKYLCLLSIKANKDRLLDEIAKAENVSVSALETAFRNNYNNIIFKVLTWEYVFEEFEAIQPKDDALRLWIQTLKDYFPTPPILTREDQEKLDIITNTWEEKIEPIVRNLTDQISAKSKSYGYVKGGFSQATGQYKGSFCGNYFDDPHTGMVYWIGAHRSIWAECREKCPEKHCLFVVQVSQYNFKLYNKTSPIQPLGTLSKLDDYDCVTVQENQNYVFSLIDLVDVSNEQVDEMAERAIKVMNAVRDGITVGVK